jgi:hypothetical protein
MHRQLAGAISSLLVGWWGFPWGLIYTPVQIVRNIGALKNPPDPSRPSDALRKSVVVNIGRSMVAQKKVNASQPPPGV